MPKPKSSKPARVTAVDLFAGAGGFSLAARKVGVRVLAAVENNEHACNTYRRNLIKGGGFSPKLYEQDIVELTGAQLTKDIKALANGCDLVMGGPPCQGFSTHRIKGTGVCDPRNTLLLHYFSFVSALKPKVFLVENVPGLLWPRHTAYLDRFYALAREADYTVELPVLLNARDYGVPQNRKRVFILGVRRDSNVIINWPPKPTHFSPTSNSVVVEKKPSWRTAATVFRALPKEDPNAIHMKHGDALLEAFRSTPLNGGSRKDSQRMLPCHTKHDGHKDVYGRINPKHPGPTMTTACINPSKGRFVHPTANHGITLRHAARFQSFPDTFMFDGGLMAGGVQVGNAVPPNLAVSILRAISAAIKASRIARAPL